MSNDVEIVIGVRGETEGAKRVKRELDSVRKSADSGTRDIKELDAAIDKAGDNFKRSANELKKFDKQAENTSKTVGKLKLAVGGIFSVLAVQRASRFSDEITTLETNLRNVTSSTQEYNRVFDDLLNLSLKNGDSIDGLSESYLKLNLSLSDNIKESFNLVKITELLSRGFAASGTAASTASATVLQLTQGLAGNFESAAQELNSLIEGAPLLARLIAEELGQKSAVGLKRLAEAGELTAESFLTALSAAEEAIKSFEIPPVISRSVERVQSAFKGLVSESSGVKVAVKGITSLLDGLAYNLDTVFKILGVGVAATLPLLILQIGTKIPAAATAATTAFAALNVVIAANPILAVVSAVTALSSAFFLFREEIFETLRDVDVFGVKVTDVFFTIKNTAIEVFKSLAKTIATPFIIVLDVFKSTIAQLKKAANTLPKVNFKLSVEEERLSTKSILDILGERGSDTASSNAGLFDRIATETKRDIEEFAKLASGSGLASPDAVNSTPYKAPIIETTEQLGDNLKEANKSAKKLSDTVDDGLKDIWVGIERDIAQAFKGGFENGKGFFDKFASGIKSSFSNLMGEIAYQAARPIALNLVAGVTGGAALTGGSRSSLATGLGSVATGSGGGAGGGLFGTLGNIGSGLINGGLYSSTLGGIGAKVGANLFGGGQLLSKGAFVGSQALGNMGYGMIGSMGANLLGLGGGIGGTIGGTLGSIAGGGIGASMGTILGLAGGPVGAIVGSFLGTAVGGLFGGGSTPSRAIDKGFGLDSNGLLKTIRSTSDEASDEQKKAFSKLSSGVTDTVNTLMQSIGASVDSLPKFIISQTRREGIQAGVGSFADSNRKSFGSIESAVDYALTRSLSQADLSGVSSEFEQTFKEIFAKGGKVEDRIKEVVEAKEIYDIVESFEKVADSTNPLRSALDALDAQFSDLKARAIELGLPVDKLTEAFNAQRQAVIDNTLSPLQDWLDSQVLSNQSSLSITDKLSYARSQFDENLSAISSGDYSNIDSLTQQASQLLQIGRDVFASGEGFTALESFVRQSVVGVGDQLGGAGSLDGNVGQEIVISNAEQTSLLAQLRVINQQQAEEIRKLRKTMERVSNQLTVQR